jgi:hypothetical protein
MDFAQIRKRTVVSLLKTLGNQADRKLTKIASAVNREAEAAADSNIIHAGPAFFSVAGHNLAAQRPVVSSSALAIKARHKVPFLAQEIEFCRISERRLYRRDNLVVVTACRRLTRSGVTRCLMQPLDRRDGCSEAA